MVKHLGVLKYMVVRCERMAVYQRQSCFRVFKKKETERNVDLCLDVW